MKKLNERKKMKLKKRTACGFIRSKSMLAMYNRVCFGDGNTDVDWHRLSLNLVVCAILFHFNKQFRELCFAMRTSYLLPEKDLYQQRAFRKYVLPS